jgi:hypothetical protein
LYSAAQAKRKKRTAKAGNKFGTPLDLKSKVLAAVQDPFSPYGSVFAALSTGRAVRVNIEVSGFLRRTRRSGLMPARLER